jgi:hypothetical protein
MVVEPAPPGQCVFAQNGQRVSHAHLRQHIEGRMMHALDISIGKWLVRATLK